MEGETVKYNMRKSGRAKYLQLRISSAGTLELVIPKRVSIKQGIAFLFSKKDWISKHLHLLADRPEEYRLFGKELRVTHGYDLFVKRHELKLRKNGLFILSPEGTRETTEKLYNHFLRAKGKDYLPKRAAELAEKYNFNLKKVTVRGQKTRWGSCSGRGTISLNFNLLKFEKRVIDYVIVHELCHLYHMNHSKKFWREVERILPDYKELKKQLSVSPASE